jgi:hypothetical protein
LLFGLQRSLVETCDDWKHHQTGRRRVIQEQWILNESTANVAKKKSHRASFVKTNGSTQDQGLATGGAREFQSTAKRPANV